MKLNQITPTEDEILSEGLIRVIGKVLKWAAVIVGTVLLIGLTKRIFFPEEEKEQLPEDIKVLWKVVLGMRFQVENIRSWEKEMQNLGSYLKDETEAYTAIVEFKRIEKDVRDVNFVLWYGDRKAVNKVDKVIAKISKKTDLDIKVLYVKRETL